MLQMLLKDSRAKMHIQDFDEERHLRQRHECTENDFLHFGGSEKVEAFETRVEQEKYTLESVTENCVKYR